MMPTFTTRPGLAGEVRGLVLTLGIVAVMTVLVHLLTLSAGDTRGTVLYILPVLVAATRWGLVQALVAALCGATASAYFFFPPAYSLQITDPREWINLTLYIVTAVVVSQLASRLRSQLRLSRQREIDLRDLYSFSRRLAVAFDVSDIHVAIEDHLARVIDRKVVLFAAIRENPGAPVGQRRSGEVPETVLADVQDVARGQRDAASGLTVAGQDGETWLVRAVSPKGREFGVVAVNFGHASKTGIDELRIRVDAVLADATATLERLGVAHAINEARMRAQTDQLRDAMIGSVSHELRTPLASILGAATVLSAAPALENEPKLRALAHDVRDEAERLNNDIQNLLDATRISSEGIKPHLEWCDPHDIVNSAIERCRRRLQNHSAVLALPADLPLIHVDAVLVQQALVQLLDNAVKYSPEGSRITLSGKARHGRLIVSISDEGAGLTAAELPRIWERFARGERHAANTSGSGLGLWIANAFIAANGGRMSAVSDGPGRGTTVAFDLPVTQSALTQLESDSDE